MPINQTITNEIYYVKMRIFRNWPYTHLWGRFQRTPNISRQTKTIRRPEHRHWSVKGRESG